MKNTKQSKTEVTGVPREASIMGVKINTQTLLAVGILALAAFPTTSAIAQTAPPSAPAATGANSITPLNNLAGSIIAVMTGPIARAVGTIAIAGAGYGAMTDRMEKRTAGRIAMGIILVLGAPTFISWFDTFV